MLRFSLWKTLFTISWVTRVYIVCVKNLVKHFSFLSNREFHGYLARWPFSRSTCKMTGWHDSLSSSHVLHMWPFCGLLYSRASHELVVICTDLHCILDFSPISHIHPLQLNLHKYREMIDWITTKFGMELKLTKASWKSRLYIIEIHVSLSHLFYII